MEPSNYQATQTSRRCINCSILIPRNLRIHTLDNSPAAIRVLSSWVAPTTVTASSIVCHECFLLIQATPLDSENIPERAFGHHSLCFACGRSTLRVRRCRVPLNCSERNIILKWIPLHQVSRLESVCRACWRAASREVQHQQQELQRQHQYDSNRPSLQDQEGDNIIIPVPPPLPSPSTNRNIQSINTVPKITSGTYKRAASTANHCIFTGCHRPERLLVPSLIRDMLLLQHRFYVPPSARICYYHRSGSNWGELTSNLNDFTSAQFDHMMNMMERAANYYTDFSDIETMPPHLCHYWLGLSLEQFHELLSCVPRLSEIVPNASIALTIYIIKLRTGDSNERLSSLFRMARSTLEKYMNKARDCLTYDFVPNYLGFGHLSVQNVASRNKIIPDGLFGNPELPDNLKPAIVICDATYVFIQNSSNYLFQKQTYSLQKLDNLVKPFLIVCCDGHIIECLGPYKATINDATITSNDLRNEQGRLRSFFKHGDVFILDKGFRDVIHELESCGFKAYMPESLLENEHQLTTLQANRTRFVTMCRWVVEIINGRIKRDYRLFRNVFNNRAARHLMADFRIACALINKFHQLIEDPPQAAEYVAIARSILNIRNYLSEYIEEENINRRRRNPFFSNIEGNTLERFPILSIDDLKRFALGSYQLKQARSYYGEHVRESGLYLIELCNTVDDDLPLILGINNYLIRGRIRSRHVSSRTYYTYLLISNDEDRANTLDAIAGYCCSCVIGRRTVGCCAHTMTMVWYLSWGRYNDISAPASFLDDIFDHDE